MSFREKLKKQTNPSDKVAQDIKTETEHLLNEISGDEISHQEAKEQYPLLFESSNPHMKRKLDKPNPAFDQVILGRIDSCLTRIGDLETKTNHLEKTKVPFTYMEEVIDEKTSNTITSLNSRLIDVETKINVIQNQLLVETNTPNNMVQLLEDLEYIKTFMRKGNRPPQIKAIETMERHIRGL